MKNFHTDLESVFKEALDLRDKGDLAGAIRILRELSELHPNIPPVLGMLAGIYYLNGDMKNAADYFKRTIVLSPKSETASRGLFHALFAMERIDEAFDEMRRFTAIAHSEHYDAIIKEFSEEYDRQSRDESS